MVLDFGYLFLQRVLLIFRIGNLWVYVCTQMCLFLGIFLLFVPANFNNYGWYESQATF